MNMTSHANLLLIALLAVPGAAAAETTPLPPAILRAADAYRKAVLAADAAAVAATFEEDGIEMPACRQPLRGKAAIERYYRDLFQSPVRITEFTFSPMEAKIAGDTAYLAGAYRQTWSGARGGAAVDTGNFIAILKRGGSAWKTAYIIHNSVSPQPPCSAAAAFLPPGFPPAFGLDAAFRQWLVRTGRLTLGAVSVAVLLVLAWNTVRRGTAWKAPSV